MIYGRIQQKADTSANWAKATNFIPLKGEIIIYTDKNQFKIGDGTTKVNELPFADLSIQSNGGIIINEGVAEGICSIAGGTTDKDMISGLLGGLTGSIVTLHPSQANGALSIALGADNVANTGGSVAMGYDNISGGKGYYVTKIDTTNKQLTLSEKQNSTTNPGTVSWSKGDILFY